MPWVHHLLPGCWSTTGESIPHELVCKYEYLYFSWYIQQLKLHYLELIITGKFNHSTWSQFSTWSNSLFASWFNLASNLFNLPSSLILLWYPYSLSWPVCNAATVWTACQPHPAFRGYMFDWWMIAFVWIIVTSQLLGFRIKFINTIIKKSIDRNIIVTCVCSGFRTHFLDIIYKKAIDWNKFKHADNIKLSLYYGSHFFMKILFYQYYNSQYRNSYYKDESISQQYLYNWSTNESKDRLYIEMGPYGTMTASIALHQQPFSLIPVVTSKTNFQYSNRAE